jgi:hypothetical protein
MGRKTCCEQDFNSAYFYALGLVGGTQVANSDNSDQHAYIMPVSLFQKIMTALFQQVLPHT